MKYFEEEIGEIDHYFAQPHVAGIWIRSGKVKLGDKIHIKGHTTDFEEVVSSLQLDHQSILEAKRGNHVGIPVHEKVRPHDRVFVIHMDEE